MRTMTPELASRNAGKRVHFFNLFFPEELTQILG
jgi:hypothetical protein